MLIPARNEENNISRLLEALKLQTYPSGFLEIIVIDDHSTDQTSSEVKKFPNVRLLTLSETGINSYKKKAIEKGIEVSSGEIIITTDADCIPPPDWITTLISFRETYSSVFIAAPVVIDCNSSLVQVFQSMDFMVLQGITGAAVYGQQMSMCNGANLLYEKKAFKAVDGFSGIDEIASGDDMLLMHKISNRFPKKVHYLKTQDALVSTQPVKTWKAFFDQRIRWASKAKNYDDKRIMIVLAVVYLFNLSFIALLIAGVFDSSYWMILGGLWILKTLVELPLFISVAVFFNKQWAIKWFFIFQPIHIVYTVISGFFGQFGKYEWKGRQVK